MVRHLLLTATLGLLVGACATVPGPEDGGARLIERGADAWRRQDYGEAATLLQRAALQGNARAQYALGYMYYNGQGVKRDTGKALDWIRRAADRGDRRAVEALGTIASHLSERGLQRPAPARDGAAGPDESAGGG